MAKTAQKPALKKSTVQDIFLALYNFWNREGCCLLLPYDIEKGAGTFNPSTFFGALGRKPWRSCFAEPSRRPKDGRYGEHPHRVEKHLQFQVIIKPSPDDILQKYFTSLEALGIVLADHDLRLDEDDWESPTLGAWGLGWQVLLDGIEITQFTYFQQMGGFDLNPITCEITYGVERINMYLAGVESFYQMEWGGGINYADLRFRDEREVSIYNFERADVATNFNLFKIYEGEAYRLLDEGLLLPAYEFVLKCSHTFNILDARGAISVTERAAYIGRIRKLARLCAQRYLQRQGELEIKK